MLNLEGEKISDIKLHFTETIDITSFVFKKEMAQITYDLYGVISNINPTDLSPHFIASCKSPVDNKWYKYNDTIVSPINDIKKDVIDFGTPYILFYQKNIKNSLN